MMTFTRTITQIRSGNLKSEMKRWLSAQAGSILARLFSWALSHEPVQQAVADAFTKRATVLCRTLDVVVSDKIGDELRQFSIDADQVEGLGRAIDEAIECATSEMSADDLKGFDDAVEKVLIDMDPSDMIDSVAHELAERLTTRSRR